MKVPFTGACQRGAGGGRAASMKDMARAMRGEEATPLLDADLAGPESMLGAKIAVAHTVKLLKLTPVSADPGEVAGLVRIEVTARLEVPRAPVVERVRVDRSFQVGRTTLPDVLSRLALFVADPDVKGLSHQALQAAADPDARTLVKMFTDHRLQPVPDALAKRVAGALSTFAPDVLAHRAGTIGAAGAGQLTVMRYVSDPTLALAAR